jgi:hypothetical protein
VDKKKKFADKKASGLKEVIINRPRTGTQKN